MHSASDPIELDPSPSQPDGSVALAPPLPPAAVLPTLEAALAIAPLLPIDVPADALSPSANSEPASERSDRAVATDGAVPPAPLVRTAWLRRVTIWACALAVPGLFVGDYVGAALGGSSLVALLAWSTLVALNVGRARPATIHGRPPHPAVVVLAWFFAPAVAAAAALAVVSIAEWAESGTFDEQGSRSLALAAAFFLGGLALLIAAYQPYRLLAKCASRVKADPGRFRKWFVAPIIAALAAVLAQVLAGLVVLSDGADGSFSSATTGAAALWVVSFALPWLAWLIFGSRAMRSLDLAVAHAHGRAVREAMEPADYSPVFTARNAEGPEAAVTAPSV